MSSARDVTTQDITWSEITATYPDNEIVGQNGSDNYTDYSSYPSAEDIPVLLNVTGAVPLKYAMPLYGYVMPVLLLISIVANTLIVVVLAQRHMRSPTNLVLLVMAISDLLTPLFPAPWYFYMYTLDNHSKFLYPTAACYAYHIMTEAFPAFFHTVSIWLTLLLAAQRYICVCHPTMARTWCTIPKMRKAMVSIYIIAMLHQSTQFFERVFEPIRFRWRGGLHDGCMSIPAEWVRDIITVNVYYTTYYAFRILFVHIGPCLTLVILNTLLLFALRKAELNRQKLSEENLRSVCKKLTDSNRITLMLIVVITVFLAVEIPLAVTSLLHVMKNLLDLHIADYNDLNSTVLFTNFFIILSYPVNFAIYCGMNRQFRETFKDLFSKSS